MRKWLAGGLGFEPRLTESESAVLPLNYPPRDQVPEPRIGAARGGGGKGPGAVYIVRSSGPVHPRPPYAAGDQFELRDARAHWAAIGLPPRWNGTPVRRSTGIPARAPRIPLVRGQKTSRAPFEALFFCSSRSVIKVAMATLKPVLRRSVGQVSAGAGREARSTAQAPGRASTSRVHDSE